MEQKPTSQELMIPQELKNEQLGLNFHYWNGIRKDERIYLASEIMKQLGYKGGTKTLHYNELEEGIDMITVRKSQYTDFFKQLQEMNSIGYRAGKVILLYESGVHKLILRSKKPLGVLTRNWIAREVLPSLKSKGYYDIAESQNNALSYLFPLTEEKIQIKNSKTVNGLIYMNDGDFRAYHNTVHKLVNGMTAQQIKTMFNSKESARAILRQHIPENAATEAMIDEIYFKYKKTLEEIEATNIHKTAPPLFKSLYDLGIDPTTWLSIEK